MQRVAVIALLLVGFACSPGPKGRVAEKTDPLRRAQTDAFFSAFLGSIYGVGDLMIAVQNASSVYEKGQWSRGQVFTYLKGEASKVTLGPVETEGITYTAPTELVEYRAYFISQINRLAAGEIQMPELTYTLLERGRITQDLLDAKMERFSR